MIILRQKEFASKFLLGTPRACAKYQGEGILIELIKILGFYDRKKNLGHWIYGEIVGRYFKEVISSGNLITDSLVRFEDNIGQKSIRDRFKFINFPCGIKFIESTLCRFKKGGDQYNKYSRDYKKELDKLNLDPEYYQRVLKYLALSFSEVINPKLTPFWDSQVDKLEVNYSSESQTNTDLELSKEIISDCLIQIKGYE